MSLAIKKKKIYGHEYFYLVYKYRVAEKVKEKHIRYLGKKRPTKNAVEFETELTNEEIEKIRIADNMTLLKRYKCGYPPKLSHRLNIAITK